MSTDTVNNYCRYGCVTVSKKESDRERKLYPDELFEDRGFVWRVNKAGYRWENLLTRGDATRDEKPRRVLTDGIPFGQQTMVDEYNPLSLPPDEARKMGKPLFVVFAETPRTEAGAIEFANRWGALGDSQQWVFLSASATTRGRPFGRGEEKATWLDNIRDMSQAVELWKALHTKNKAFLNQVLQWKTDGGPAGNGAWVYANGHAEAVNPPEKIRFSAKDPTGPAWLLVQRWINKHLRGRVSPQLLWHLEQSRYVIRVVPRNLLGAMWLQFSRAIAGEVGYRPCKVCSRWLTISTDKFGFRTDREFCSAACRQKDHRRKVREARELEAAGRSVQQIAKHFQTEIGTINNWLTKEK